MALELYAWWRGQENLARIAYGILVAGVLTGVLAASTGFLAFYTLPPTHTEEAHTIMYGHLGLQVGAIVVFAAVVLVQWRLRERAPYGALRLTSLVAAGLLVAGSYLGGHLVYRGATGIDPKALAPDFRAGTTTALSNRGSRHEPYHGQHEHEDATHHRNPAKQRS